MDTETTKKANPLSVAGLLEDTEGVLSIPLSHSRLFLLEMLLQGLLPKEELDRIRAKSLDQPWQSLPKVVAQDPELSPEEPTSLPGLLVLPALEILLQQLVSPECLHHYECEA